MDSTSFNTLFTGKFFLKLNEIDSTNNFLKDLITNSKPLEGTVILAESQKAGRGQMGTSWITQPNANITLSILYQPKWLKVQDQFLISAMTSWAIYELISELLPSEKIEVKWPNDIMIDRQKVCGVLIENSIRGEIIQNSIIGIGLNVLQKDFGSIKNASSLSLKGYGGTVEWVTKRLVEIMEKNYMLLKSGKGLELMKSYHEVLLGKDEELRYKEKGVEFFGKIRKVCKDGKLIVETENGLKHYYHKEVELLL